MADNMDLSQFSSEPSALILGSFPFESHGAFEPEGRVPSPRVVEAIDVLEQRQFTLLPSIPGLPPD